MAYKKTSFFSVFDTKIPFTAHSGALADIFSKQIVREIQTKVDEDLSGMLIGVDRKAETIQFIVRGDVDVPQAFVEVLQELPHYMGAAYVKLLNEL